MAERGIAHKDGTCHFLLVGLSLCERQTYQQKKINHRFAEGQSATNEALSATPDGASAE
jgi:hypothetical protein